VLFRSRVFRQVSAIFRTKKRLSPKNLAPESEKFYLHQLAAPGEHMTKNEIATMIAGKMEIRQTDAKQIIQMVFDGISDTLASEGRLELRRFGVFEVVTRKAHKARNPKQASLSWCRKEKWSVSSRARRWWKKRWVGSGE